MTKQQQAEMLHEIYTAHQIFCARVREAIELGEENRLRFWQKMEANYESLARHWGQAAQTNPKTQETEHEAT